MAGAIPLEPPALQAVLDATGGRGAAAVIDAVGNDATLTDALGLVRAGAVSVVGVHDEPVPVPGHHEPDPGVTLRMTTAPVQQTWPELMPLIQSGRLDTSGIFTHTMPLDDAAANLRRGGRPMTRTV